MEFWLNEMAQSIIWTKFMLYYSSAHGQFYFSTIYRYYVDKKLPPLGPLV